MNQLKIGTFIAQQRKKKKLTQIQLADHLGITSKAISKWETGKSMPDVSLFLSLCKLLDISLNELFLGEEIPDNQELEESEQVLLELINAWIGSKQTVTTKKEIRNNAPSILELQNVQKTYHSDTADITAINNINLRVGKGNFVGIMGASGSGKTTLLNLIATIDTPTRGTIKIDGTDITNISEQDVASFRKKHLGFVFQDYNLLDAFTVHENIALALTIKETQEEDVKDIISNIAVKLDISMLLDKYPYELSGGQYQRCICARAIATSPSIILAYEPTSALDTHATKQLLESFCMLCEEFNITILMATHDALSASYCDEILLLEEGSIKSTIKRNHDSKQVFFSKILDVIEHIGEV